MAEAVACSRPAGTGRRLVPWLIAVGLYEPLLPFAALAWIEPDAPSTTRSDVGQADRAVDREVVHNRLPLLRADFGLSRAALADELGIHYQTIGYIERGEYAASLHLALRIARRFDLPVEAIFSLEPFERLGATALLGRPTVTDHHGETDARDR